ncbi:pyrroline-5-carboxylate reductase family protein [Peredibacter sp. HCB2-198]|uniref:pyrroline-5-carboxylate reductase family protein n=1 Tax=Peredibacter sp. HCB2-198 TaxID=3383025 RepID=UPI0038B51203
MRVLVLGAGKMTEAILTGFKASEDLSNWMIFSPSGVSAKNLSAKIGAKVVTDLQNIETPDWILVGCKPQQLPDLKQLLGEKFKDSLFVSILAAVSEEEQRRVLNAKYLIRVMPNLPVEYREGVSLLCSESARARLGSFEALFTKLGTALIVSETELDELTLLTGSGPAFFYEFAKNLSHSFESMSEEQREKLVRQVLLGAAKSGKSSKKSLSEMTDAVTSKAGVTIAVLENWRSQGFSEFVKKGIEAGKKRTEEIKALLRQS